MMSLDSSGDLAAMASPAAASRNENFPDWDIVMSAWKARVHDSLKLRITILSGPLNKVTVRNGTTTVQILFHISQVYQEPDRLENTISMMLWIGRTTSGMGRRSALLSMASPARNAP